MPCYFYKNQFSFLMLVLEAEFVLNFFLFWKAFLYYCFARFPGFYNIFYQQRTLKKKRSTEVVNESTKRTKRKKCSSHKIFFAELSLTFLTFLSEGSLLTVRREHVHTVRLHTRINNRVFKKSNVC